MIIYDTTTKRFKIQGRGRAFEPGTQTLAVRFAEYLVATQVNSPQDLIASRSAAAQDLCHHLSHGDIERMVLDYLNGDISLNQFMILVGSVLRPSWSNLIFPRTLLAILASWTMSLSERIGVLRNQYGGNPVGAAEAANRLVHTLNSAITNLRYSDRSSNRSIQGHFDLRLHRGGSLDPIQLALIFYARFVGRPAFAAESSALLNDWEVYARSGSPVLSVGMKMSESDQPVARTSASNRPVMGTLQMPVQDQYFRGSFSLWVPFSVDSLLYMLGCWLIAYALGMTRLLPWPLG